jgi:uncharacterized protein YgiM (DUF1202 family)
MILKKLFLLALLFGLSSTVSIDAQQYYGRVSDPDGYTNIRTGASVNSPITRRYYSGYYLYYTPMKNGWSKVYSGARSNTFMGYMHTSRIVRVNPNSGYSSSTYTSNGLRRGTIVDPRDNYVNVRKGPGTNYSIVTCLYVGTTVYYQGSSSNWVRVYNSSMQYLGYVYRNRIR